MGPPHAIRLMAICLFRRGDTILVAFDVDSRNGERYARPLCGGIEFGERAVDALRREIREEVGAELRAPRLLGVIENLFTLNGQPGHEVVFVLDAEFADPRGYDGPVPLHDGPWGTPASWTPLAAFRDGETPLYPKGLLALADPAGAAQAS